ncbi:uncharacterized protein LOC113271647 isoform X1 [Papaver somniferum]|uniref:uncharacterized protein LOC113271647 isoform X1 n=1 Tax=Papaver somniferum TaxID=3469 RepID=UPI000E7008CB|nr:uncharacterized protein LOC113271647 isoform X1 [Papaver somniferum]XP_026377328.1 uncharacterized protein LOC113271647 isoform X1 [Papaver somniferum]
MENQGKKILLTTNGDEISENIALHLVKRGCRLVLMGNEKCVQTMVEKINGLMKEEGLQTQIGVVGVDMEQGKEEDFDNGVEKAYKIWGNLDALVNCYSYEGKIQDCLSLGESEFMKIVKVNFMAAWFLLKAVGKRMRDAKSGGSVIFLTSFMGSERGLYPGSAAYGSCLAGVQQLVRTCAIDIGKHRIRVNAIARGLHLQDEYILSVGKEKAEKSVNEVTPLHRWLDVKNDIASTVIYLVSDDARYMTGTTIYVDGAQSLVRPRMRSFM